MRFQKSWFQVVSEALTRARFTRNGRPPSLGYFVARCSRRGKAGLVVLEIHGDRTLRKVLPDGRAYVHKNCSVEEAMSIIGSAAIDSDFYCSRGKKP